MARTEYFENHEEVEEITELVPCKDNAFLDLTVEQPDFMLRRIENAKCLDPLTTTIDGNEIFGIQRKPGLIFQQCEDRTDVDVETFCQGMDAFQEWLD